MQGPINGTRTTGFESLKQYLITKLLWDPYMTEEEFEEYIDEFFIAYYGPCLLYTSLSAEYDYVYTWGDTETRKQYEEEVTEMCRTVKMKGVRIEEGYDCLLYTSSRTTVMMSPSKSTGFMLEPVTVISAVLPDERRAARMPVMIMLFILYHLRSICHIAVFQTHAVFFCEAR